MTKKMYSYILSIMKEIKEQRQLTACSVKHKTPVPEDHPKRIQSTIVHVPPTATDEIILNKRPRFT